MDKIGQRTYIQIRTKLGIEPIDIWKELQASRGADAYSLSTVERWAKKFREDLMDVEDEPRPGRPITTKTQDNIEWVRSLIEEDPHSTYADLEAETSLSHGTIFTIIHEHLQMRKVSSRWVPHQLTQQQKQERVRICRENLARFASGSWRLSDIITGDETWIYHRQIGRKASNACWVSQGQSPTPLVRRDKFEPKTLFSLFFRSKGPLLIHAVGKEQTVDKFYYIANCLKPVVKEVRKQRPKKGLKGMRLLHDNAKPHDNPEVFSYLKDEGLAVIPHPPYSPDLAPCDFWLNDYIKRNLDDHEDAKSLRLAVTKLMREIPKEEYRKTFQKLLERMQLCIDNQGEYFEHLL
jgi:histone-lysine N-methyltransferase SETMAR